MMPASAIRAEALIRATIRASQEGDLPRAESAAHEALEAVDALAAQVGECAEIDTLRETLWAVWLRIKAAKRAVKTIH